MRKNSSRNTADTSSHINIECADEMNIPVLINVSFHQFQIHFCAHNSMKKMSSRNTADTSLHIYTEYTEKINIPLGAIYSEFENKTWSY